MPKVEPLWTINDAADFLRSRPSTLYARAAQGKLPHIVLWEGRRKKVIRFDPEALREFVRQNSVPVKSGTSVRK